MDAMLRWVNSTRWPRTVRRSISLGNHCLVSRPGARGRTRPIFVGAKLLFPKFVQFLSGTRELRFSARVQNTIDSLG